MLVESAATLFIVLPFVYDFGPPAVRYFSRLSVYYLGLTVNACIVSLVGIVCGGGRPNTNNMLLSAQLMQPVARLVGLDFRVVGSREALAQLRQQTSYVVVVNHQHAIDVLALFHLWRYMVSCTVVAKVELILAGPFGLAAWICGTTFINRKKPQSSKEKLHQTVAHCKELKMKVLIFPEGTRFHKREEKRLLPFKKGAFSAALRNQVPILPIVISHYGFLDVKRRIWDPSAVDIHVLDPIPTDNMELSDESVSELSDIAAERMLAVFRTT